MDPRIMLAFGLLPAAFAFAAAAAEKPIELKPGPGLETVKNNCGGCHSLDYIGINSSFMNHATWEAEVNKMIKAFGAPIDPKDVPALVDYLTKNYGKPG
jgi:sulfite dehydrogenase (cytochrome) subunit B